VLHGERVTSDSKKTESYGICASSNPSSDLLKETIVNSSSVATEIRQGRNGPGALLPFHPEPEELNPVLRSLVDSRQCSLDNSPKRCKLYATSRTNLNTTQLTLPSGFVTPVISRSLRGDMWTRPKKLRSLHEELQIIAVFERLEKYATELPSIMRAENVARRETRRSQILAEIESLESAKSSWPQKYVAIVSLVLVVSSTLSFYLLR